ncbi:kinase-like domain-containing protein [Suillus discolor]|uniref:Kinase-like domain-containing protein n=1 Tax=Suillus discolor TaxID=1912936 RepID=A0A9P7FGY4_9AGAM|nr:kinase-like domain-containing protein [Suillus discolor]KAG2115765.1 kinase-like domain-containing protein [Suillus discolor]
MGGSNCVHVPVFWTTRNTIVTALRFPDTRNSVIYEFDAPTLKTIRPTFEGHTGPIIDLALSLDCALLASASSDNTIKLWDFESRQLLASFKILSIYRLILSPDSRQLVYTTRHNSDIIYLCNTPPEILTSIQPVPQVRTSAPKILLPLADSRALSITANQSSYEAPPNVQQNLPYPRRYARSEYWSDRQVRTPRIQPTETRLLARILQRRAGMRSLTHKTLGKPYELGFQLLRQDAVHSDAGPTADLPSITISPHISQTLSSTVGSRLPQLPSDLNELLPSSSHTHTVTSAHHDKLHYLPPEAMLQNLTGYITKDEEYPVARGGFGEIWKCTFYTNRRPIKVAVKALQVYAADQLGAAKTKKNKRIIRELRICANLKHPNILRVYGYTHDFGPFIAIVSPWAGNGNLTDYLELKGVALTLVRRFRILKDIIAGLQYLHTNSVIHGDFTGPNVLILDDDTACVADFGLSLMYSEVISASQASWTSTFKGNMRWMAPELLVEREDGSQVRPSEQSDMYSFGGIMLQVLTNKVPYYHLTNDAAIILCIAKSQTPSRSRYPELPEKYWQLIEQCWSTHPQDRPSTEGADVTIRNEFYSLSRSG